jgi:hypothetical protein
MIMIIMPILNSRTGVLFALTAYGAGAVFSSKKSKSIRIILRGVIVVSIILLIIMLIPTSMIPIETLKWVKNGAVEIARLVLNKKATGTFANIAREIKWPSNLAFGEGVAPEYIGKGNIDMGYCQCVWRYGIIGTVLLVLAFASVFVYCYLGIEEKTMRIYVLCIAIFFYVYMYKLYSLNNMGANFIMFYSLSLLRSNDPGMQYELETC